MGAPSFDNQYARLPESLYARLEPTPVRQPRLVQLNDALADELGLDLEWLRSDAGVAALAGNQIPGGAEPLAQAYAGHQFGNFTILGDGRAILLGEIVDRNGRHRDIQLKGSGRTPYSRGGDGRASLGPVLRELIVAEAMNALGIPTTRSLAAVVTGEPVFRQAPERGAILTRVAASHVRVGTFEYFAAHRDLDGMRALLDFCIERHQPDAADAERPALELLRGTMARQAQLIARWMGVGFIHGVMNTDNTTISGETIDYGPCAFMDTYDPGTVFSSIDRHGRYAYGAQPAIIAWNMSRLAQALLPLIDDDGEQAVALGQELLDLFPDVVERAWLEVMGAKLGIREVRADDRVLIMGLLDAMHRGKADFTNTFRALASAAEPAACQAGARAHFDDPKLFDQWSPAWLQRLQEEDGEGRMERMRRVNPVYIPRNHLVEAALEAAISGDDYGPLETLMTVLSAPYEEQPDSDELRRPPGAAFELTYKTFCGT